MIKRFGLLSALVGQISLGSTLPNVSLKGDQGGLVAGGAWDSTSHRGQVLAFFYVDPDEKDANEKLKAALKKQDFEGKNFQSVVVINMEATAIPNFILSSVISSSQEENPHTVYVEDRDKVLVKKWGLQDDAFNVVVMDESGKVLFKKAGELESKEVSLVINAIVDRVKKKSRVTPTSQP